MVDALREAWRVLAPNGDLVDLRPFAAMSCPIEVVGPRQVVRIGELDASGALADDLAADAAIRQLVQAHCLLARREERFSFEYSFETVAEMAAFLEGRTRLAHPRPSYPELEAAQRSQLSETGQPARLRISMPVLLAVYRKVSEEPDPATPRDSASAPDLSTRAGLGIPFRRV